MLIWGKPLQPCFFKGAYLFHRTSHINFLFEKHCLNRDQKITQRKIVPEQIPLDLG